MLTTSITVVTARTGTDHLYAEELGEKPRTAFQPIRLAITGSKISPGLFESMELLGKERSLARLEAAAEASS